MATTNPITSRTRVIIREIRAPPIMRGKRKDLTVGFFDLAGSTARKLERGHLEGLRAMSTHNTACTKIGALFGGRSIKLLGDGVLMIFDDPLRAVLASVNVRYGLAKFANLSTKVGLTTGLVEIIKVGSQTDIIGSAVDRCARLESIASAGQIVIDRPLFDAVRSYLKDYRGLRVGEPVMQTLSGIGDAEVREVLIGSTHGKFQRFAREAFRLYEGGRLPLAEKAKFLESAQSEVIEIGIGLVTFATYFHKFDKSLFKEPVRRMIKRGVSLKCFAIDPDTENAKIYCKDRQESDYLRDAKGAFDQLRTVKEEFLRDQLPGSFELYTFHHIPYFHAMCADIGEDQPSRNGRIVVSNYLFATKRADCPGLSFSARSNPKLFGTYWKSIRAMTSESHRLW
jgi:class 3 adenylate cyclase